MGKVRDDRVAILFFELNPAGAGDGLQRSVTGANARRTVPVADDIAQEVGPIFLRDRSRTDHARQPCVPRT